jgi:hypothetical protein
LATTWVSELNGIASCIASLKKEVCNGVGNTVTGATFPPALLNSRVYKKQEGGERG